MNTKYFRNLLLTALLSLGLLIALLEPDLFWAICFGAALLQRLTIEGESK